MLIIPASIGAVHTSQQIGIGLTEALARGLGCALASGFQSFGPRVNIDLEFVEYGSITQQVRTRGIVDPKDLLDVPRRNRTHAPARTGQNLVRRLSLESGLRRNPSSSTPTSWPWAY